jgi:hypothetical protein
MYLEQNLTPHFFFKIIISLKLGSAKNLNHTYFYIKIK